MKNKNSWNIIIMALFLLTTASFISCSDFLDPESYDSFLPDDLFKDVDNLGAVTLGVYSELATTDGYGRNVPNMDAFSDLDMIKTGSMNVNYGDVAQLANFNVSKDNSQIQALYKILYESIYRANEIIANAHQAEIESSDDQRRVDMYIAEAKAARAFFYFELVKRWGDIPMRLEPKDANNLFEPRTDRKVIYDQIIGDMQEAIPDLPWHNDTWAEPGHMTKGAAMGLLTRICLFAGGYSLRMDGTMQREANWKDYYELADEVSNELVNSGRHSLNTSYENIFYTICQNKTEPLECLFEIQMAYLSNDSKHASCIGGGAVKVHTSRYAWCKYDAEDTRLYVNVGITDPSLTANYSCNTNGKWRQEWQTERMNWNQTDINNVILRYAEVLLMRAEILNVLNAGPNDEAVELVNKVRRRGYGLEINEKSELADVPEEAKVDELAFAAFLRDEYARELLGEGGRRFHLIRWNLLKATIDDMTRIFNDPELKGLYFDNTFKNFWPATMFVSGKHELYPIPTWEMTENHGFNGINNPGY